MSKRDFVITLFPVHMKLIEDSLEFHQPSKRDTLYFNFDSRPNLEKGDIFTANLLIEEPKKGCIERDIIKIEAEVLDIVPPMMQPANEEKFDAHMQVISKYIIEEITNRLRGDYFNGNAERTIWTVYFKKIKQPLLI